MTTEAREPSFTGAIKTFFLAPFRLRTYSNLLYLMLAFPLGLAYFIFLAVGLPLGLGLTIVWIGIPILALVFAGSWGISAMERQAAIHMLGADVPPMMPPPVQEERSFWQKVYAFYTNPVTWKGMGFQIVAIIRQRQRGATHQILQRMPLFRPRRPEGERLSAQLQR